jgi:hypothetical protein
VTAPHSSHLLPPRVRALDESQGRRATWLELFFDLVFVVAVAQLSNALSADKIWASRSSAASSRLSRGRGLAKRLEAELLVLRYENAVLRRQVRRIAGPEPAPSHR